MLLEIRNVSNVGFLHSARVPICRLKRRATNGKYFNPRNSA